MENEVVYISVDIEASGPIPEEYSMLSIDACEVGNIEKNFYTQIRPISERYVKECVYFILVIGRNKAASAALCRR